MLAVSIYISRGEGGIHGLHCVLKAALEVLLLTKGTTDSVSLPLETLELSFIPLSIFYPPHSL